MGQSVLSNCRTYLYITLEKKEHFTRCVFIVHDVFDYGYHELLIKRLRVVYTLAANPVNCNSLSLVERLFLVF
jgi:hypothetical protein